MKKILIALILTLLLQIDSNAQQASIIDPNAITVPRFANASAVSTAIPSPIVGMFIYRTDTQSFWYYSSSGWTNLAASASGSQWTTSGNNIYNNNIGNVGIGNSNPAFLLDISKRLRLRSETSTFGAGIWFNTNDNSALNTFIGNDLNNNFQIYSQIGLRTLATINPITGGLRIEGPTTPSTTLNSLSLGGYGKIEVDKPGIVGGRFTVLENGNVGIGVSTPNTVLDVNGNISIRNSSLSFKNIIGVSTSNNIYSSSGYLVLNGGNASGGAGVAINNTGGVINAVQFNTDGTWEIYGNKGTTGQMLTSNGNSSAPSWKSLGAVMQNMFVSANQFSPPNNNENPIPNSTITFTAPTAGKLIIYPKIKTKYACLNPLDHCHISADFFVKINGNYIFHFSDIRESFQEVFAYLAPFNIRALGPYFVNVSAGTHTITFHYKLNTITPAPQIDFLSTAQFIPN